MSSGLGARGDRPLRERRPPCGGQRPGPTGQPPHLWQLPCQKNTANAPRGPAGRWETHRDTCVWSCNLSSPMFKVFYECKRTRWSSEQNKHACTPVPKILHGCPCKQGFKTKLQDCWYVASPPAPAASSGGPETCMISDLWTVWSCQWITNLSKKQK